MWRRRKKREEKNKRKSHGRSGKNSHRLESNERAEKIRPQKQALVELSAPPAASTIRVNK